MSTEKYHTYRGDVRALAAAEGAVSFVTVHPEGQATALYHLDADTLALTADPLPAGGQALLGWCQSGVAGEGAEPRTGRGAPGLQGAPARPG